MNTMDLVILLLEEKLLVKDLKRPKIRRGKKWCFGLENQAYNGTLIWDNPITLYICLNHPNFKLIKMVKIMNIK